MSATSSPASPGRELDILLLISGAFAGFPHATAVREVGGFDPACLVEDYELIHRLHRQARERGATAKVRILGGAFAATDAPASIPAFLRQRRRWFARLPADAILEPRHDRRAALWRARPRHAAVQMPRRRGAALRPRPPSRCWRRSLATGRFSAALAGDGLALAKLGFDLRQHGLFARSLSALDRRAHAATAGARLGLPADRAVHLPAAAPSRRGAGLGVAARRAHGMGRASRAAQGRTARNSSTPSL